MVPCRRLFAALFIYVFQVGCADGAISFASYYANSMVLQSEPSKAVLWGFAENQNVGQSVVVTHLGKQYAAVIAEGVIAGRATWNVTLDSTPAGGPHVIQAVSEGQVIKISDVMFGEVWVCSGQSNMEHALINIDNGADEVNNAAAFENVRLFRAGHDTSYTPKHEIANINLQWTRPDQSNTPNFSGVCWLFGRRLYAQLNKPIGLVQSTWGGTRIEAWSSPEALANCQTTNEKTARDNKAPDRNEASVLWNAMIHPLLPLTIKGAIWYQGESNVGLWRQYNCSFPAMISDWRSKFHVTSGGQTDALFPFGFVQLAGYRENPAVTFWPELRQSQTAWQGYAPNSVLQNVFMAVALDLPDFNSPHGAIHPRYKQDIGRRLAISGLSVAYGENMGRWYGPRPCRFTKTTIEVEILFEDGNANLQFKNSNVYDICCSPLDVSTCNENLGSVWLVTSAALRGTSTVVVNSTVCNPATSHVTGVRYAWRESPCALRACSLYSTSAENEMPTPPFYYDGDFQ